MLKRFLHFMMLLAVLTAGSGCATLFSGSEEDVTFRSTPEGAQVIIDGFVVGTTPTTVSVDRPGLEETKVTLRLDGYEEMRFELDKEFNTTSILNIFFWPGFIVDALTGALFKYDKTTYMANLNEGTVSLRLDELRRGPDGQYLLPETEERLTVIDPETGLQIVFK